MRLPAPAPAGNGFATTTSEWLAGGSSSDAALTMPSEEYGEGGLLLPEAFARHVGHWLQRDATIVGGCCGVGPPHIAAARGVIDAGQWRAAVAPAPPQGAGKAAVGSPAS